MSGAVSEERFIEVAGNRLLVAIDGRSDGPWLTCLHALAPHLIACGLIGDPVPPVMMSGGPQKKNS
jgi:hypothetical protein